MFLFCVFVFIVYINSMFIVCYKSNNKTNANVLCLLFLTLVFLFDVFFVLVLFSFFCGGVVIVFIVLVLFGSFV